MELQHGKKVYQDVLSDSTEQLVHELVDEGFNFWLLIISWSGHINGFDFPDVLADSRKNVCISPIVRSNVFVLTECFCVHDHFCVELNNRVQLTENLIVSLREDQLRRAFA
jgi:hypothetical protein